MGLTDIPVPEMFEYAFGKKWGKRVFTAVLAVIVVGIFGAAAVATYRYGKRGLELVGLISKPSVERPQPLGPQPPQPVADGTREHPFPDPSFCPKGSIIMAGNYMEDVNGPLFSTTPGHTVCYFNGNTMRRVHGPLIGGVPNK